MTGHIVKRMAMATSEDGGPKGRTIQVDDYENTVFGGKVPWGVSDDPIGQTARTEHHQTLICYNKCRLCVKRCKAWANRCKRDLQLKIPRDRKTLKPKV